MQPTTSEKGKVRTHHVEVKGSVVMLGLRRWTWAEVSLMNPAQPMTSCVPQSKLPHLSGPVSLDVKWKWRWRWWWRWSLHPKPAVRVQQAKHFYCTRTEKSLSERSFCYYAKPKLRLQTWNLLSRSVTLRKSPPLWGCFVGTVRTTVTLEGPSGSNLLLS